MATARVGTLKNGVNMVLCFSTLRLGVHYSILLDPRRWIVGCSVLCVNTVSVQCSWLCCIVYLTIGLWRCWQRFVIGMCAARTWL